MISRVLDRQPDVRALFDNGWLTLVALDSAGALGRRYEKGVWSHRHPRDVLGSAAA